MSVAWIIILALVLLVLAIIAALAIIPLKYQFLLSCAPALEGFINVRTAFLYRCQVELLSTPPVLHLYIMGLHFQKSLEKRDKGSGEEAQPESPAQGWKERLDGILETIHLWSDTRLMRELWSLVKDLIAIANPERLEISGRFGFENPAHTGYLLMLTLPLAQGSKKIQFDAEPVWDQEIFEFKVDGQGSMKIYSLLFRLLKFARNKKIRSKYDEYKDFQDRRAQKAEQVSKSEIAGGIPA